MNFYNMGHMQPAFCVAFVHETCSAPWEENHVSNSTAANRKVKVFTPFVTPYTTLLPQWISGNDPRVKHLQVDVTKPRTRPSWLLQSQGTILHLNLIFKKLFFGLCWGFFWCILNIKNLKF